MGAFGELFGFEGRIGRLGYLGRGIVATLGVIVLAIGGGAALLFVIRPMGLGEFEAGTRWLTIAIILLWLWSSFALANTTDGTARTWGWSRLYIVPLYGAFLGGRRRPAHANEPLPPRELQRHGGHLDDAAVRGHDPTGGLAEPAGGGGGRRHI